MIVYFRGLDFSAFATKFQTVRFVLQTSTQAFWYDIVFIYWSQIYTILVLKSWDNSRSDDPTWRYFIQPTSPCPGGVTFLVCFYTFFHFFACIKGGIACFLTHTQSILPFFISASVLVLVICCVHPSQTHTQADEVDALRPIIEEQPPINWPKTCIHSRNPYLKGDYPNIRTFTPKTHISRGIIRTYEHKYILFWISRFFS